MRPLLFPRPWIPHPTPPHAQVKGKGVMETYLCLPNDQQQQPQAGACQPQEAIVAAPAEAGASMYGGGGGAARCGEQNGHATLGCVIARPIQMPV